MNQDTQDFKAGDKDKSIQKRASSIATYGRVSLYDCAWQRTRLMMGCVLFEAEFWRKVASMPVLLVVCLMDLNDEDGSRRGVGSLSIIPSGA